MCIYMNRCLLFLFMALFLSVCARANNVRVTRDIVISAIEEDHVNVDFSIAWENSWRDDFNWDAVYIFLKFRKKGETEWRHVKLRPDFHRVSSGYEYWLAQSSSKKSSYAEGIFVYRDKNGAGGSAVDLTLQWASTADGLTKKDFTYNDVEYTAMCIEMVYVPNGLFYAGDNYSSQTLKSSYQPILEKWDLIKLDGKIKYDSDVIPPKNGRLANPPENAANHVNVYGSNRENAWSSSDINGFWKVTFPSPVTVRYFGVSAASGSAVPSSWELQGRKGRGNWETLFTSTSSADWPVGPYDSYPISKALKIEAPKAFDQYMIKVKGARVALNNVSMTDQDLSKMTDFAYVVDNYKTTIPLNTTRGMYADDKDSWSSTTLHKDYPSGFWGFYVMKYEVSQEQYVRFLNKLSLAQQKKRTIGEALLKVPEHQFVFSKNKTQPEARNGIVVMTTSTDNKTPIVFGNNLNTKDDVISRPDDGMTVACNFLSPEDMWAYADWTGLRPMSELEFEKAARPSFPDLPQQGEFAWNSGDSKTLKYSKELSNPGTSAEKLKGANVNGGNKLEGPVRCGSFAYKSASREMSGGSYWGVMELSGNLAEICYNVNTKGRGFRSVAEAHGDGSINTDGTSNVSASSYWPSDVKGLTLRGGSFGDDYSELSVSDRTKTMTAYTKADVRDSKSTFRLAHSFGNLKTAVCTTYLKLANGNVSTSNGAAVDTVCSGSTYVISGSDLLESSKNSGMGIKDVPFKYKGRCEYVWYISENSGNTWNIIPGARDKHLTYDKFVNDGSDPRSVFVKRLMITPEYASMTNYIELKVINDSYLLNRTADTIRPNNAVAGCLVETRARAYYTWRWKGQGGNAGILQENTNPSPSSYYWAERQDFDKIENTSYTVECEMRMGKCIQKIDIDIYVEARQEKKAILSSDMTLDGADLSKRCGAMIMDPRDGEVYGTVRIGDQCWMSENLRHSISGQTYIQNGEKNQKSTMGFFYKWNAVVRDYACPAGWSLPTDVDFKNLKAYLNRDGNTNAGLKMKSGNMWSVTKDYQSTIGNNSSGFSAWGAGWYGSYMGTDAFFLTHDNHYFQVEVEDTDLEGPSGTAGYAYNIRCILNFNK